MLPLHSRVEMCARRSCRYKKEEGEITTPLPWSLDLPPHVPKPLWLVSVPLHNSSPNATKLHFLCMAEKL